MTVTYSCSVNTQTICRYFWRVFSQSTLGRRQHIEVYIKQENDWVWIRVSVCACTAAWVDDWGWRVGWAAGGDAQGLGQGALWWSGTIHICTQNGWVAAAVLAALFVGDNGPKSKTDSLLRGNAEPASELIKQLLYISEGAASLMSDTRTLVKGMWPLYSLVKKRENLVIYDACQSFTLNSFS